MPKTTWTKKGNRKIYIVGNFNIPLLVIDRTSTQKISKNRKEVNNTINQLDLIDIYGTLHSTAAGCTFFSSAGGTLTKKQHILDHKIESRRLDSNRACSLNTTEINLNSTTERYLEKPPISGN